MTIETDDIYLDMKNDVTSGLIYQKLKLKT